jgi:hypothetical protein
MAFAIQLLQQLTGGALLITNKDSWRQQLLQLAVVFAYCMQIL